MMHDVAGERVLIAKVGLDGHDRGAKIVSLMLRDAGFEVIYAGLRQTPQLVAAAAVDEDVSLVGLSILSGAHGLLVPEVIAELRRRGSAAHVVVGGIIPEADKQPLIDAGVAAFFGPGDSSDTIVATVRAVIAGNPSASPAAAG